MIGGSLVFGLDTSASSRPPFMQISHFSFINMRESVIPSKYLLPASAPTSEHLLSFSNPASG